MNQEDIYAIKALYISKKKMNTCELDTKLERYHWCVCVCVCVCMCVCVCICVCVCLI